MPKLGDTDEHGTTVTFKPDATIFETTEWDTDVIKTHLREKTFLNKDLRIHFRDEKTGEEELFHEQEGIAGFIREMNENQETLSSILNIHGVSNDIEVDVSFQYVNSMTETIISYCNNIPTNEGGTHVTGLRGGMTRLINGYVKDLGISKDTFDGRDIRSGLVAVVSIKHPDPQYEGQTKTKLGNSNAKIAVEGRIAA